MMQEEMKLHFEDVGTGDPTVLLHGFTGAGCDWIPLIPMLPEDRRYIVPDLRGHGRSPNPDGVYSHRQSALDVFGLLDDLRVSRFSAVGMSGGAMALLHMATQQAERVVSMVLVSPTTHYPPQARQIMAAVNPDQQPVEEWQAMRAKHPFGDEQIRELWRLSRAFKDDFEDMSFTPSDLRRIQARTMIVHGDSDPLFPLEIAETIDQSIAESSLWVIPGGGHVPVFGEEMTEFFVRASAFLALRR